MWTFLSDVVYRKWHVWDHQQPQLCGHLIDILWRSHLEFGVNDWKWSVCRPPLISVGLSPPIGPQEGVLQPQVWPQHRHRHGDCPRCQKEDVTVSQGTDLCTLGFEPTTLVLPPPFSTGWGTKLVSKVCFCVCFLVCSLHNQYLRSNYHSTIQNYHSKVLICDWLILKVANSVFETL